MNPQPSSTTATEPGADTRPCAYCGRPVPQRGTAGRPFRYCRDNDGACQRAFRNQRMRQRNAPGLAGQVARSWELVDRLEQVVGTLAEALHAELSPAGVERQLAEVRAEAAAHIAAAQTERDEARRAAEQAEAARREAQQAAAAADADREAARQEAQRAAADAAEARAADLAARLTAAEAERDAARDNAARLTNQVSDLAAALASLSARPTPSAPPADGR